MNWEAIGAISEVVGVLAVIITLVYLARSIRQNSHSLAISALGDITAQWNNWSNLLASSDELADIVVKGNQSYSSLSASEALRYGAYIQTFFDNVESSHTQIVEFKMDKDLSVLTSIVERRIRISGFCAWWKENTADYDNELVDWIEGIRPDT